MRYLIILAIAVSLQNPPPSTLKTRSRQQQPTRAQQPTSTQNRGTEDSPIFVKQLPTEKTQAETDEEAQDRKNKTANDGRLILFTGMLAVVGFFQLLVFGYQAYQLRETVRAAIGQSIDTKNVIKQSARTAKAMEDVAKHFETSVTQAEKSTASFQERMALQTRAYVAAAIGVAIYQEREKGLKFEVKPLLMNTGQTPAHKLSYRAKAAILPIPLPQDFAFPLPDENTGQAVIFPHQSVTMNAIVEDFVDDAEVNAIKHGEGKCLYIWGVIAYEDQFGKPHDTKFCHAMTWLPDGKNWGLYVSRFNEAT